jgi:hypothetical protein
MGGEQRVVEQRGLIEDSKLTCKQACNRPVIQFLTFAAFQLSGKLNWVRNPAGLMRGGDKIIVFGVRGRCKIL